TCGVSQADPGMAHHRRRKRNGRLAAPVAVLLQRMDQAVSGTTTTLTVDSTSACRCTTTSNSPVWRSGPSPITTSDLLTSTPSCLVRASAISRGPTEPYSLPSVEALAGMVTLA